MANGLLTLDTYKEYLNKIGIVPSKKLERCFACGLPAVWMYLKAIGLEDLYFDMLSKLKRQSSMFKELFYLLILTNGDNKFFPHLPKDFIIDKLPPVIAEAQVQVDKPAFEMAYTFTRDQLIEVLSSVAQANYMVRIGNQRQAVGIMYAEDGYHVYHVQNPRPVVFKNVAGCADLIMRVLNV